MLFSLFTPAQGRMLQNMRHTRSIRRVCLETYPKDIVLIILGHMHIIRIGLVMR